MGTRMLSRAQVAVFAGVSVARIHSYERFGACQPTEAREFGETRPALYDTVGAVLVHVVAQADRLGLRGADLGRAGKALTPRRSQVPGLAGAGWAVVLPSGLVDLVPVGGLDGYVGQHSPPPSVMVIPLPALPNGDELIVVSS